MQHRPAKTHKIVIVTPTIRQIDALCGRKDKSLQKWLDNQDVCMMLNISKRTLQPKRDNGTLPYSQINHKMYYKLEDVKRIMEQLKHKPYGK
jgi:hypothetical protein